MKRLKRYSKQILALMSAILILVGGIFSTSFQSNAEADGILHMYCDSPIVDDNHGYILLEDEDGSAILLHWVDCNHSTGSEVDTTDSFVSVRVNNYSVEFKTGSIGAGFFGLYCYYQNGQLQGTEFVECSTSYSTSYSYTFNWSKRFVSYAHGGEFQLIDNLDTWTHDVPVVVWGGDTLILKELSSIHYDLSQLYMNGGTQNELLRQLLNEISEISLTMDSVESILAKTRDVVYSYLSSMDKELKAIADDLDKFIEEYFPDLLEEEKKQTSWLEKIWNSIQDFLGMQGEESTEPLPDEEVGSVLEEEDKLMQDTTDAENSLDFSVDSNSNNVVWNVIERVLNANPRVFGAFIGIMTLGVITLLLNR